MMKRPQVPLVAMVSGAFFSGDDYLYFSPIVLSG